MDKEKLMDQPAAGPAGVGPPKNYVVERPFHEVLHAPGDLLGCDKIEVRVTMTGLKFWEPEGDNPAELRPFGQRAGASYCIDRRVLVDSKDHRVLFHLIRELLLLLAREYLGVKL